MTAQTISFLDACRDRQLLGFTPWTGKQTEIVELLDSGAYRDFILALGRRSGKTRLAATWGVYSAVFRDLTRYQPRGETRYIAIVATNTTQARITLDLARGILEHSPLLASCVTRTTEDTLELRQPGTGAPVAIRVLPCSSRAGRGLPISDLICDELAHMQDGVDGPAAADRVVDSLTPALAQFGPDARFIAISTPWGRANKFHALFEQASSGRHPDMLAITAPTWDVNPSIDAAFFDKERAKLGEDRFLTEYAAEFRAGGGALIEWERIEAAVADHGELSRDDLNRPVAALDVAFSRDPFALAIVGREHNEGIPTDRLRLGLVRSWVPKGGELGFVPVLDEVARICDEYGVKTVLVDQYASVPVRQHLQGRGLHAREVTMSLTSKTAIYSVLRDTIHAGRLELYKDDVLLAELGRVEAHYAAGGLSIRIPRVGGSHGDRAQALALAVHELAKTQPQRGSGPVIRVGGTGRRFEGERTGGWRDL